MRMPLDGYYQEKFDPNFIREFNALIKKYHKDDMAEPVTLEAVYTAADEIVGLACQIGDLVDAESEISKIVSDIIYKSEIITEGLDAMRPDEE